MAYQQLTLQKCQTVALTLKFNMRICDNSIEEKFTNQINTLFEMRKHVQNIETISRIQQGTQSVK